MRADAEDLPEGQCPCTCLGNDRGDSPLCPLSPEASGPRPCIRDDVGIIEYVRRLSRRRGFQKLKAGKKINLRLYDLEWYDQPGYEWESALLEVQVVEDMLEEEHLRDADQTE